MDCPANDRFANSQIIANEMAEGMVDDVDLWMMAELTGDPYAADGFFGFDPYGGKKPEDLTIWSRHGFLPPTEGPAHYELRFPEVVSEMGQIRRLHGPPKRVLVAGAALDKVELSFSSDASFGFQESDDLQPLQPES